MSKAFKCDRCKKCFDPWSSEEENFEFGRIQDYSVVTPVGGSFDYTYRDEELHLCPECNRAFGLFMQNRGIDLKPVKEPERIMYAVEMVPENDPPKDGWDVAFQFMRVYTMAENEKEAKTMAVEAMRAFGLHARATYAYKTGLPSRKNCTADNEKDGV